jgi:hypothetical protein
MRPPASFNKLGTPEESRNFVSAPKLLPSVLVRIIKLPFQGALFVGGGIICAESLFSAMRNKHIDVSKIVIIASPEGE